MSSDIDDLMTRFNSLNVGQHAVQPIEPDINEDYLPPNKLQDRLNQLRNPEKMERNLEDYERKQRKYVDKFKRDYDNKYSTEREELPLDTDVYSEAVKKIQKVERGRQSRKKYTKKKPVQKKSVQKKKRKKKKKKKKRYYGGTLTQEQLRKKRLRHLGEPISDTSDSSNTRRLKEHFLTGIEEDTHSSNFEPEPEPEPANEVAANEEFPLGTGAEHWLPEETEKELYNSIVGTNHYPTIEDCRRLKEYCVLFPKTCYLNKKFLEEKVHVCREVVKTNNAIKRFFSNPYSQLTAEAQRELGLGRWHQYENWKEIIENIVKDGTIEYYLTRYGPTPPGGNYGLLEYRQSDILNSLRNIVYKIYNVNPNNRAEVDEFNTVGELYGQGYAETWMDIVDTLKKFPAVIQSNEIKNNFNTYLYEFSIELKEKGYPIMLIEKIKQEFMDLLSIYDI